MLYFTVIQRRILERNKRGLWDNDSNFVSFCCQW